MPRFLCDVMLGRLCKWLRLLGYDCRYADVPDEELVALARADGRVLLTRDTGLMRRRDLGRSLFIRHDRVLDQLQQVGEAFGLDLASGMGTRCSRCNLPLQALERAAVAGRVPAYVWHTQESFARCPACARIYWPGTHWEHMAAALRGIAAAPGRTEKRGSRTEPRGDPSVPNPQSPSTEA